MAPGVLYEFQKRIGCCTSIALFPMLRPELVEMRATVKRLKADADMRLTLDVEAQQSFEFLSDQIHGLRRAFSTLSDVFVEEIDLMRAELIEERDGQVEVKGSQSKALNALRDQVSQLRTEIHELKQKARAKSEFEVLSEARVNTLQEDVGGMTGELSKVTSAHHLLQLEVVELRTKLDEALRAKRAEAEAAEASAAKHAAKHAAKQVAKHAELEAEVRSLIDAHAHDARASMHALDADLHATCHSLRLEIEREIQRQLDALNVQLNAQLEGVHARVLELATFDEKVWAVSTANEQQLEHLRSQPTHAMIESAAEVCFFFHLTHFSQMSEPILPISHL
tara:strand:- start:722 stop:1735 length:1014 start_codon:yes stop_codon:yes gene_type:complete